LQKSLRDWKKYFNKSQTKGSNVSKERASKKGEKIHKHKNVLKTEEKLLKNNFLFPLDKISVKNE
jgi:hypothetical protein